MDLTRALIDADLKLSDLEEVSSPDLKNVYFTFNVSGPDPNEIQDSFDYVEFDQKFNLKYGVIEGNESKTVLNCREEDFEVVKLLVDNHEMFGFNPVLVFGFPSSVADSKFEGIFYASDRINYDNLIDGLAFTSRIKDELLDASAGVYDREKSVYIKKDGTVKEFAPEIDETNTFDEGDDL